MKAIIIEDQHAALDYLKSLINHLFPNINIVAQASSVNEAVDSIVKHKPDIVFSDVKLGNELSFSAFEQLEAIDFSIIFTTAFDEFAIKAFKLSAIDYILKPIDPEELKIAVHKAIERIDFQKEAQSRKMKSLISNIKAEKINKIALPDKHGFKFFSIENITRCEADDNYTKFFFDNKESMLVCKTIKEYELLFADADFLRIHKTHLINLKHIVSYDKSAGTVKMKDGANIPVARRRKEEFQQLFATK